jgi:hypothetical protein
MTWTRREVAWGVALLLLASCGKAGIGEPCTKQGDCERGAICFNGKCESPDEADKVAPASDDGEAKGAEPSDATGWEVFRVSRDQKDPFLNVRAKRKSKSKLLAKLPEGTPVEVLETQGKWRKISVTDGEHEGKGGWVHTCCVKPAAARDLYWARLGPEDHSNSRGTPIESAAGILRQDRANYHKLDMRDDDDRHDLTFHDAEERAWLSKALKESLDDGTKGIVHKRQPLVEVVVYRDRVDVNILDPGPKHQMTWDEANELCMRRYCKCATGKGTCKHDRYETCMKARGQDTDGHGCGRNL